MSESRPLLSTSAAEVRAKRKTITSISPHDLPDASQSKAMRIAAKCCFTVATCSM
jgi:hypothetical protein